MQTFSGHECFWNRQPVLEKQKVSVWMGPKWNLDFLWSVFLSRKVSHHCEPDGIIFFFKPTERWKWKTIVRCTLNQFASLADLVFTALFYSSKDGYFNNHKAQTKGIKLISLFKKIKIKILLYSVVSCSSLSLYSLLKLLLKSQGNRVSDNCQKVPCNFQIQLHFLLWLKHK